VAAVSPNAGPTTGGTQVTITGNGLAGATGVYFGASKASVTGDSATQITATSPPGTGTDDITVTTPTGRSSLTSADQFTYVTPPAIIAIKPSQGYTTGGSNVFIFGTNFTGVTAVHFGGIPATFKPNGNTAITAVAPPDSTTGPVDITVITDGVPSALTSHDVYTYITPPPPVPAVTGINPTGGSVKGGLTVVITGTGFTGATAVSFGSTGAMFAVKSDATIIATSPSSASPGPVSITVTTPGGTSVATASSQFTYS